MKVMAISEFKAKCLAVLDQVRTSGEPVLVTRRGEPVAEVVPASRSPATRRVLGSMAGTAHIVGDVIAPAVLDEEWEALSR